MGLSASARNNMLDCGLRNQTPTISITHASLHTANPDPSGGSEVTGGSPAYARKSITWSAASGGSMSASNQPVFDVPAATTVTHVGFFSASTAGTYFGMADVTDETFGAQGTYTLTSTTVSLT
jgi:hypothetical protein